MPANFRTFESQSRLLAAVVASHPGLKLDFKEIAKHFGDSTPGGIEFQFRNIKKEAKALKDAVANGDDVSTIKTGGTKYRDYKNGGKKGISSGDDEEEFKIKTPKKDPMNKTKTGRIMRSPTKTPTKNNIARGAGMSSQTPMVLESDNEVEQEIKAELEGIDIHGGGEETIVVQNGRILTNHSYGRMEDNDEEEFADANEEYENAPEDDYEDAYA